MILTNSLTGGGAERSMNLVCNELAKRGWPIALVPINAGPHDEVIPTCEVFQLERKWQGTLANTASAMWKLNKVVKAWNPDILVLNCDLPELFGALLLSRRQLIAVEHINRPWITRLTLGRIVRQILRFRKVKWVAVSAHLSIWPNGEIPDSVVLNSILPISIPLNSKLNATYSNEIRRLFFVGRLAPQKRPDWILEIGRQANLPMEVIGEGLLRESLEERARQLELTVNFRGQITHVWEQVKDGDLLIVPSEYEGDGLVVIEGIQQGLPILLADIPDFRRFGLPEKNYCKDVNDFVKKIDSFRTNQVELLVPEEISKSILASRSMMTVGNMWEDYLNSI